MRSKCDGDTKRCHALLDYYHAAGVIGSGDSQIEMIKLADKTVLVLGLGETGLSLVRWLSAQGVCVRVADTREYPPFLDVVREQFPQTEIHCGAYRDEVLDGVDLMVISPGVPVSDPFVMLAKARAIPVMGDIELFSQSLPQENRPKVIAITGSNGKTTVTSMVGEMCRAAGLDVAVAGNISPAVLDVLLQRNGQQPDVWVLELSSFQLETMMTLNADAATVLNISEDHLDRYASINEYVTAKSRIFQGSGVQILNRDDRYSAGMGLAGRMQATFGLNVPLAPNDWGIAHTADGIWLMQGEQRVMNAKELQVIGRHNVSNALAAAVLCHAIGLPLNPQLRALRDFKGLPHRVQQVAEIKGVIYYDDSKGTNVGATVAALQGLGRPAVLIAGGDGKGQDFLPLRRVVSQCARAVVLIGRDANKISASLQNCGVPILLATDMADAVRQSAEQAKPGDAVLLSPACASFDMFRNYKHRAEVFVAAVQARQKEVVCAPQA